MNEVIVGNAIVEAIDLVAVMGREEIEESGTNRGLAVLIIFRRRYLPALVLGVKCGA
jgi:hypothetical protein